MSNETFQISSVLARYRSGIHDLKSDFFIPCMRTCNRYQRAVGYFTSSALKTWAETLPRLIADNDVSIQLLVGPQLSEDDHAVLARAIDEREAGEAARAIADKILLDALAFTTDTDNRELRLKLFGWMISNQKLQIQFGFPTHQGGDGIYHEKMGIFRFPSGEVIGFDGSPNESESGHMRNFERLQVFRSWKTADSERLKLLEEDFDAAWNNHAAGLSVVQPSPSVLLKIKMLSPADRPKYIDEPHDEPERADKRWRHQDEACEAFLARKHGILEMATGTGKTRTALRIIDRLIRDGLIQSVIVATGNNTGGNDLLEQWADELESWNDDRNWHLNIYKHFGGQHGVEQFELRPFGSALLISRSELFRVMRQLKPEIKTSLLVIHDEVHALGSPTNRSNLRATHADVAYVLGLSATPDREYDSEGNKFIEDEIGVPIYTFSLQDAIRRGILCEFKYMPLSFQLTPNDRKRLAQVYKAKAYREKQGNPMSDEELWMNLASVYKTAEMKIDVLETYISKNPESLHRAIIFVHTEDYGRKVVNVLQHFTHSYKGYFSGIERDYFRDFSSGKTDVLLTCHRLSQGIDIRDLKAVFLMASDRSRLETIQRIGRCLRVDPENPLKRALVVDFVLDSDNDDGRAPDEMRSKWLTELSQVKRDPHEY